MKASPLARTQAEHTWRLVTIHSSAVMRRAQAGKGEFVLFVFVVGAGRVVGGAAAVATDDVHGAG